MKYKIYKNYAKINDDIYFVHFIDSNDENRLDFFFSRSPSSPKMPFPTQTIFHMYLNSSEPIEGEFNGVKISDMNFEMAEFICKL